MYLLYLCGPTLLYAYQEIHLEDEPGHILSDVIKKMHKSIDNLLFLFQVDFHKTDVETFVESVKDKYKSVHTLDSTDNVDEVSARNWAMYVPFYSVLPISQGAPCMV